MAATFRIFKHTDVEKTLRTLRVREATQEELQAADLELSAAFNEALLEGGLPPRAVMLHKLKTKGLWTQADESELGRYRDRLVQLNKSITRDKFPSTELRQAAFEERLEVFQKLNDKSSEVNAMLQHTADAKADEAHRQFLLCCVIEEVDLDDNDKILTRQDGKKTVECARRLWPQVDDMNKEEDADLTGRCVHEFLTFNAGIDSTWEADAKAEKEQEAADNAEDAVSESAPETEAVGESSVESPSTPAEGDKGDTSNVDATTSKLAVA